MPRYEQYEGEGKAQADARIAKNKKEDAKNNNSAVDMFMDDANINDNTDLVGNSNMEEWEVKVLQSGLNVLNKLYLGGYDQFVKELKVDGVMGPDTMAAFKMFYTKLPKESQAALRPEHNPLLDVDGKL
jgi:hypothetical protein